MPGYYGAMGVENEQQARDLVNQVLQNQTGGFTPQQQSLLGTGIYRDVAGMLGMRDLAGNPINRGSAVTHSQGVAGPQETYNPIPQDALQLGQAAQNAASTTTQTTGQTPSGREIDWFGSYEAAFPPPDSVDENTLRFYEIGRSVWDALPPEARADQYYTVYSQTISDYIPAAALAGTTQVDTSGIGITPVGQSIALNRARQPLLNLTPGQSSNTTDEGGQDADPGFSMPTMDDVRVRSDQGPFFGPEYKVAALPQNPFSATATPGERYLMSLQDYVTTREPQPETGMDDPNQGVTNPAQTVGMSQGDADYLQQQTQPAQETATPAEQLAATQPQDTGGLNFAASEMFSAGATSPNNWAEIMQANAANKGVGAYLLDPWIRNGRFIVVDPSGNLHQTFDEAEAMQLAGKQYSNEALYRASIVTR